MIKTRPYDPGNSDPDLVGTKDRDKKRGRKFRGFDMKSLFVKFGYQF